MEVNESFVHFGAILGDKNYVGLRRGPLAISAEGVRRKQRRNYSLSGKKGNERQVLDVLMVQKLKHLPVFLADSHSVLSLIPANTVHI